MDIRSQFNIKNSKFISNRGEDAGGVAYIIQTDTFNDQIFEIDDDIDISTNETTMPQNSTISIIRDFELNSENNKFYNNEAGQYGGVYRHVGYAEDSSSGLTLICTEMIIK